MNKTVLITGANRGIGLETAKQLGQMHWDVIITGRNKSLLADAKSALFKEGIKVQTLLMDLNNTESITHASKALNKMHLQLDALINNAAILLREDQRLHMDNISILDQTVNTNVIGTLNVIKAFLPFLKSPGRIINISSEGGSMSNPVGGWSPAYCVSKSMLNAVTRQLAYELNHKNIAVNAVDPGWTQTEMGGVSAPRTAEQGDATQVWLAAEADQKIHGKFFRDKKEVPW